MRHQITHFPKVSLFLLIIALGGCSTQFVYQHLDGLVPWYVDRYVDLDRDQKKRLKHALRGQLAHHRQHRLPAYIDWLSQLRNDVQQPLDLDALHFHYGQTKALQIQLMTDTVPLIGDILLTLSDEQVSELMQNLEEEHEDRITRNTSMSDAKKRRAREKRLVKMLKKWVGRLNSEQRHLVEQYVSNTQPAWDARFDAQKRWRQRFHDAVNQRSDVLRYRSDLRALLIQDHQVSKEPTTGSLREAGNQREKSDVLLASEEQDRRETITREWMHLLGALDRSLTARQRQRLQATIADYIDDFKALSAPSVLAQSEL